MKPSKILFVFGTRPEAIKMAPLIYTFSQRSEFEVCVCLTGQHREMLTQVTDFFGIKADYNLEVMRPNQHLSGLTARLTEGLGEIMLKEKPDLAVVQGDTTSAYVGALTAFYHGVKVAHIEAGLRSHDLLSPFPEEANRKLVGQLADLHFVPTPAGRENLKKEGITKGVFEVGNTVIDALHLALNLIQERDETPYLEQFKHPDPEKTVLVTCHRRENFGRPLDQVCRAIQRLAEKFPQQRFIFPVHLNPNVQRRVRYLLANVPNVDLINPLPYDQLVWLMNRSNIILTDSGGIQEEAPALGKPVLVLRKVTERMEGVEAGTAKLVGTETDAIIQSFSHLMHNRIAYRSMAQAVNPYGDGTTARQVVDHVARELNLVAGDALATRMKAS